MWGCVRISETLATLTLALGLAPGAGAMPARVVSMNLCTDQLAMLLAAPGQLISVSFLAADPMSSAMAAEARDYPLNHGQAEEIFLMHPDLVLTGRYTARAAADLLRRLGVKVVTVDAPATLDAVPDTMRTVGAALGRTAEAEAMATDFTARLAALRAHPAAPRLAALYGAGGFTSGRGTMADDILRAAGLANAAAEAGLTGYAILPLEKLVMAAPQEVIVSATYPGTSRPEEVLQHPALKALEAHIGPPRQTGPGWDCGTPKLLDAIAGLETSK